MAEPSGPDPTGWSNQTIGKTAAGTLVAATRALPDGAVAFRLSLAEWPGRTLFEGVTPAGCDACSVVFESDALVLHLGSVHCRFDDANLTCTQGDDLEAAQYGTRRGWP